MYIAELIVKYAIRKYVYYAILAGYHDIMILKLYSKTLQCKSRGNCKLYFITKVTLFGVITYNKNIFYYHKSYNYHSVIVTYIYK